MRYYFLLLSVLSVSVLAADAEVPPPPPVIESISAPQYQPQVTIRQQDGQEIHEYRLSGTLYMIIVKPQNAPAYYLLDTDGDGSLESRRHELDPDVLIPHWILFRW